MFFFSKHSNTYLTMTNLAVYQLVLKISDVTSNVQNKCHLGDNRDPYT